MAIEKNSTIYYSDVLDSLEFYNIPRRVPKDITSYWTDGTLWNRIAGINGYKPYEGIHVGDYINMGRAVTCPSSYENTVGSQYATVVSCGGLYGCGNTNIINYNHLIMVPGQGFGGIQHFGKTYMNFTASSEGGYYESKLNHGQIGRITNTGSIASGATINQQLYYIFGSHLKTYDCLLTKYRDLTSTNRLGEDSGCSKSWINDTTQDYWTPIQARLMSEIEIYGSIVWSSSGFDTGNSIHQFELFKYNREAINNRSSSYWLKDVVTSSTFSICEFKGNASYGEANQTIYGVRPCFIIA